MKEADSKTFSKGNLVLPSQEAALVQGHDEFELMDLEDERQIRDEFAGRFVDEYVYSMTMDTKRGKVVISGLSYAGTKEMIKGINVKRGGRITATDIPPVIEEHDTYWLAKVQCEDELTGLKIWGVKKQNKRKLGGQIDEHAEAIAVSKAQRNGLQGLIPKGLVNEFIKDYLKKKGSVKQIIPAHGAESPEARLLQPVYERGVLMNGILDLSKKLAVIMRVKHEVIISTAVEESYHKHVITELSVDELKSFHRDLTAKIDKMAKPAVAVEPAQQVMEELKSDRD